MNVFPEPTLNAGRVLRDQVLQVDKRAYRLVLARACAIWLLTTVATACALAFLDLWLRNEDRWVRGGLSLVWLISIVANGWYWVLPLLRRRPTAVGAARRIEAALPQLGDQLSSAVDLFESSERETNSPPHDLRHVAIANTAQALAAVDLQQAINPVPARRWTMLATFTVLAIVAAMLLPTARYAAARLSIPFQPRPWPRQDELVLTAPSRIHAGHELVVQVADRSAPLPDDLQLIVQRLDDQTESILPATLSSGAAADCEWLLGRASTSLRVRAVGGDDQQMPWHTIDVVTGPELTNHTLAIEPPEYVRQSQPPRTVQGTRVQVLSGSRIRFTAQFSLPLQQASLQATNAELTPLPKDLSPLVLSESRTEIQVDFPPLVDSTNFLIRWTDSNGLQGVTPEQWSIEVVPDQLPLVEWQTPAQDISVTSQATIDLQWQAQDDLGIVRSWLTSDRIPEQLLPAEVRGHTDAGTAADTALAGGGKLNLASVGGLQPGMFFIVSAEAEDLAGQRANSVSRRVQIVSPEAIKSLAEENQQRAIAAARQSLSQQRLAQSQTEAASSSTNAEAKAAIDAATAAQNAATEQLTGNPEAAQALLDKAIRQLDQNQVDPELKAQLQSWSAALDQVNAEQLQPAGESLSKIQSTLEKPAQAQPNANVAAAVKEDLQAAATQQQQAIEQLDQVVQQMAAADAARQSAFELAELERRQRRLNQQSSAAQNSGQADPRLAEQQRELAQDLNELIEELKDSPSQLAQQATEKIEAEAVPTEMLQAAAALANQELQKAVESQQRIAENLAEARQALDGRKRPEDTKNQNTNWGQLAQRTRLLRDNQQQVVADISRKADSVKLAEQQSQVAQDTKALAAIMPQAAYQETLEAAAADMRTAAAGLERGRAGNVVEQPARDALQRLEALLAAAQENPPATPPSEQNAATPPGEQQAGDNANRPNSLQPETLRLWRNLQAWLQTETDSLQRQSQSSDSQTDASLAQRRAKIAAQQQALATQIEAALRAVAEQSIQQEKPQGGQP